MKILYKSSPEGITWIPPDSDEWKVHYRIDSRLRCGNCCTFCTRPNGGNVSEALEIGCLTLLKGDYVVIDPEQPQRVARDVVNLRPISQIRLGPCDDFWSSPARGYNLGKRCLESIYTEDDWPVRVATKNAAITEDIGLMRRYWRRTLVGVNISAPAGKSRAMSVLEPNASSIPERMAVLWEAHKAGLRTFVELGPLLPGMADSQSEIDELVGFAGECGVEAILARPLDVRYTVLVRTQKALEKAGYVSEAKALNCLHTKAGWSTYASEMAWKFQRVSCKLPKTVSLRFFLRASRLMKDDLWNLEMNDRCVEWVGGKRKRPDGIIWKPYP